jgi:hypothetical protein
MPSAQRWHTTQLRRDETWELAELDALGTQARQASTTWYCSPRQNDVMTIHPSGCSPLALAYGNCHAQVCVCTLAAVRLALKEPGTSTAQANGCSTSKWYKECLGQAPSHACSGEAWAKRLHCSGTGPPVGQLFSRSSWCGSPDDAWLPALKWLA